MIIEKLTLNNFGVYAGKNTFEFSCTRPIVLIGGMNGRGKTTFLESILLALYGSGSISFKESKFRSYTNYLRSFVNKSHLDEKSYVELQFVMNESSREEYVIRREWDARSAKTVEYVTVEKNGKKDVFLAANWAMFIENVLPSALSSFYFFDGEKIAELAVDHSDSQIKSSIRSMLGIGVLDVLKGDLEKVRRGMQKSIKQDQAAAELDTLKKECSSLEENLQEEEEKITASNEKLEKLNEKLEHLHHTYMVKGGDVMEHRTEMMQARADVAFQINQNKEKLVALAASELPLVLVSDLIAKIKIDAEDEHYEQIMKEAMVQIEEFFNEYTAENPDSAGENRKFIDYMKAHSGENTEPVYNLSGQALYQIRALFEEQLVRSRQKVTEVLQQKQSLQKHLDEIDGQLAIDVNEKELQKIQDDIKKQEEKFIKLRVEKVTHEQAAASIRGTLISKHAELKRATEEYLHDAEMQDDAKRMARYSTLALNLLEKYTVSLQERKTDVLGDTITCCYKKLANKKNLIQRIVMDPQTLDLEYLDEAGEEVEKTSLSAGEKQLMVIAILWALAICSKKKLPVIIDTPLSRLDSLHRTSLVKNYFPNASEQTIILSTDSEIDHAYYDMMKDSIGDEFTLHYSEETRSTTILKGYFQEK